MQTETSQLLGQLSSLHQMLAHLFNSVPEDDCYRRFHPDLPPLAWLYGRCAYVESYWLRKVVIGNDDLTSRVRHLFGVDIKPNKEIIEQLPPREHLLNWALAQQEQNLKLLANPAQLPQHSLVASERLIPRILQSQAVLLEQMLAHLTERQLQKPQIFHVTTPLYVGKPSADHADGNRGHYRIGAKQAPTATDNELPPNVVELDAFRIDHHPVSNSAWFGFMKAGGYGDPSLWELDGWEWKQQHTDNHPHHWRQDDRGNWFGIGLNGPFELLPGDAVTGISQHEALAYANWVSNHGGDFEGAVVQHEYQWEVATRSKTIKNFGRAWEWCSNPFHRYTGYLEPEDPEAATQNFDAGHFSLRGGSLHTQRIQRRSSYRFHAYPQQRCLFSGTRLVFPASQMEWRK
jgi:gamma-glutamyl hercynylcysteine S-oxide synthase